MHIPKKYYHDRTILLLVTTTVFFVLLELVLVLLSRGSGGHLNLVQYRPNLGLSAYTYDSSSLPYISFIVFSFMIAIIHILLSIKIYIIRRHYALVVLGMGVLLLILVIIVSNALMVRQ